MGLILDSSIAVAAERRGENVGDLMDKIANSFGNQEAALSSIGLTELVHGIYRATSPAGRQRREAFLDQLLRATVVYPYTKETAQLAGRIDGEQQALGNVIPFVDLLIGVTALSLQYSLVTFNLRHFQMIPGLHVVQL
jgi:predicted nucleic acid-binding protein